MTPIKYDGQTYDLDSLGIRFNTVSFFRTKEDDEAESYFGTCDLTGIKGNIVPCIALDHDGAVVQFGVLDSIVQGKLGRLAGAF